MSANKNAKRRNRAWTKLWNRFDEWYSELEEASEVPEWEDQMTKIEELVHEILILNAPL